METRPTDDAAGRFCFPKQARLLRPVDFQRVQSKGRTVDLGPLVVRYAPCPQPAEDSSVPGARLGLAVSRRAGSAVRRNRIKRLVREWFRHHRGYLAGLDLVVSARPGAAELDQRAIGELFQKLLGRLGRTGSEQD